VCVSEAVAHKILACVGLRTADAFAVIIGSELAAGLTQQFNFDPPVQPGRHWGTRLLTDVIETTVHVDDYPVLYKRDDLFLMYLVDVITAYEDRQTHGNVLFVPAIAGAGRFDVLAIDQSDCFGHPEVLRDSQRLRSARDRSYAKTFAGMEQLVIEMRRAGIDAAVSRIVDATDCIITSIEAPPDEWYDRAGIDPADVKDFVGYRLANLETLGRLSHWRGIADIASGGGGYGNLFSS
jgi:hypothetical protein